MSGWSTSFLCTSYLLDSLSAGHTWNVNSSDVIKIAVYNNTGSYSVDTALASQAFGAGAWSGNEVTGTGWATGGKTMTSTSLANVTGVSGELNWTAANVSSSTTTLASVYGALIYDNTVNSAANYGIAAIYFGGSYSVTAGTFAINWGTDGHSNASIWYITT